MWHLKMKNMKNLQVIITLIFLSIISSCSNGKLEEKGFQVSSSTESADNNQQEGITQDSLKIETQPSNVLLTGISTVRLTTIYKVNLNKKDNSTFIGSNSFHYRNEEEEEEVIKGNNWNNNLMPGFEAVYGYNFVNVSHYNILENKQKNFFEKPVLIKTLYYPTLSKDTLNEKPVSRDYFIVSAYNEDTNKDGFVNLKDLRRIFLFNINGEKQKALIPEHYSVVKSEYDSANDLMFVFAQLDTNKNGQSDIGEPTHIFWIDLKSPNNTGRQY
jgi:hypothetical protein